MTDASQGKRSERFFMAVTSRPRAVLTLAILLIVTFAAFLPRITREIGVRALMPPDLPAVVFRDEVKEIFGLEDPLVVAVMNRGATGVFNVNTLGLVHWLTERMKELPGVDPHKVTSLATEGAVVGTEEGLEVEYFFESLPVDQSDADAIRETVMNSSLLLGRLVARDGSATLIVVELLRVTDAQAAYDGIMALVEEAPVDGEEIHVAGEAAVSGYMGAYIDSDMIRMDVLVTIILTCALFLAFRSLAGICVPHLVVVGAAAAAFGGMAAAAVPYYVITNSLLAILVAISVADAIHILAEYYEDIAVKPEARGREAAVRALQAMWRPVVVTSITDMAGFLALAGAAFSPGITAFGIFAAIGAGTALLFSLFCVPAVLTLWRPGPSRVFEVVSAKSDTGDHYSRAMLALGRSVTGRSHMILAVAGVVAVAGVLGFTRLQVDEAHVENFGHSEAIYIADKAINSAFDGTYYLDVVLQAEEPEALFRPDVLRRIEKMQGFLETLPHMKGSVSIVDYLKEMNRALNGNDDEFLELPESADVVAQYFLLYSAMGSSGELESLIDYEYRITNVRAAMDSGLYSDIVPVVEAAQRYVSDQFDSPGITARLGGTVNLEYHFIGGVFAGHFKGLILALVAVWVMTAVSFRSAVAGVYAVLPVSLAILLNYAIMGFTGIWLSVATSMFAALTIGLGVDFAVHTLDRLKVLLCDEGRSLEEAFYLFYRHTGRTLFFNFFTLLLGFSVVMTSTIPPIASFGVLVFMSVLASFLGSMTFLPALVLTFRPAFLGFDDVGAATDDVGGESSSR